jgi:hypothetical protein
MEITTELISPEIAEEFLKKNHSNRKVSRPRIISYVNDMQSGRWGFNPSPIVFSENGDMIDGQHRLMSVIEAGISIEMLVMRGAPNECKDNIDSGKSRSAGDALAIKGIVNATNVAAIASRILSHEKYGNNGGTGNLHSFTTGKNPSKAEVVDYVEENDKYLQSLLQRADVVYRSSPIRLLATSEIAFLFHALTPEEKANEFLAKVVGGIGISENTPELAIRRALEKTRVTKELHYSNNDLSVLIFLAFAKSLKGESCQILRLPKEQK